MVTVPRGLVAQFRQEARAWTPALPEPVLDQAPAPGQWALVTHTRAHHVIPAVRQGELNFLAVDEAHLTSTVYPRRTKLQRSIHALVREAGGVVMATATPVDCVAATDLIGLLNTCGLLHDKYLRDALGEVRFARFGVGSPQPLSISPRGVVGLQTLLSKAAIRATLADLGVRLPEVEETTLLVPLDARQKALESAAQTRSGLHRSRLLDQASHEPLGLSRAVADWIAGTGSNHRHVLVTTERLETVDAVVQVLARDRVTTYAMTGDTPPRQRSDILAAHRRSGGVLVTSSVADTGLNLQHCSALIEIRTTWNAERAQQRLGRVCRPGNPHKSIDHVLVLPETLDEARREQRRTDRTALANRLLTAVPRPGGSEVQGPAVA